MLDCLIPQRIIHKEKKKEDRKIAETLDSSGIEFSIKEKDYLLIEHSFSINL